MKTTAPLCSCSFLVAAFLVAFPCGAGADISSCDDPAFCGQSNPCAVSGSMTVVAGSVLDCTGRVVTLGGNATIQVDDGSLTLIADQFTTNSGSKIRAVEVTGDGELAITIDVAGSVTINGSIVAHAPSGGGTIDIEAGGDIVLTDDGQHGLEVHGTSADADGGEITLVSGGNVVLSDPIMADAAGSGVAMGGDISVSAVGDITVTSGGLMYASGRGDEAGTVELAAGGDIVLDAAIDAEGKQDESEGGTILLTAGGQVTVNGALLLRGGRQEITGGSSMGGSVHIDAGCGGVTLGGDIDTSGGDAGSGVDGGALMIVSKGDVTITSNVVIGTQSRGNGGDGGDIVIAALGSLAIQSGVTIDASGNSSGGTGSGATIEVDACAVSVGSGVTIDASGYHGGRMEFQARQDPPATGPQPLYVSDTASLLVSSNIAGEQGLIQLLPRKPQQGICDNDATLECTLDADCVSGCETGQCLYANPDTDGTWQQFVGNDPTIAEQFRLPTCADACP